MTMDDIVPGTTLRTDPASRGDSAGDPIHKLGIIGARQMGSGIAHVLALSGYEVALHDIAKDKVDAAIGTIDRNLTRQVASGKITEDEKLKALSRITFAETMAKLGDAD